MITSNSTAVAQHHSVTSAKPSNGLVSSKSLSSSSNLTPDSATFNSYSYTSSFSNSSSSGPPPNTSELSLYSVSSDTNSLCSNLTDSPLVLPSTNTNSNSVQGQVFNFSSLSTTSYQMETMAAAASEALTPVKATQTSGAKSVCFHSVMGQPGHKITNGRC